MAPRLAWEKGEEGGGGDLVYVKRPLGDWAIDGGADVLVTNVVRLREYGFISLGSWSYSREWVWDLRTKLCCIATGKWNVSSVALQEFDNRYIMF